jgi:hypothetical protein
MILPEKRHSTVTLPLAALLICIEDSEPHEEQPSIADSAPFGPCENAPSDGEGIRPLPFFFRPTQEAMTGSSE